MSSLLGSAILVTLLAVIGPPSAAQAAVVGYTAVDLGTLPGAGPDGALADAVSGNIAVGYSFTDTPAGGVFHATAYDLTNPGAGVRDLDTLGSYGSIATAIDGSVVAGRALVDAAGARAYHAFAYDLDNPGAGMRDLDTLGGTSSEALAVSGRIVVGVADLPGNTEHHAFAFDLDNPGAGTRDLGMFGSRPSFGAGSIAWAVDGPMVVGTSSTAAGAFHAFTYDLADPNAVMHDLGTLGGSGSEARAMSGNIVAGVSDGLNGSHAFAYDLDNPAAGMRDLGGLGGSYSQAGAVDGSLVVGNAGTSDFATHAFAYDLADPLAGMRDLGTLGGAYSFASAISGHVVAGSSFPDSSNTTRHAFAFDLADPNAVMHDLGLPGGGESVASAINDDGVIVGWAQLPGNQSVHAVAWRPTGRIIGSDEIQPNADTNPAGMAEAFSYTASATGDVDELAVYVDSTNQAAKIQVGLYASTVAGGPAALLASGWIADPVVGTWNRVRVPPTRIEVGTQYWLAVLAPHKAASIRFRDMPDGAGGQAQTSAQKSLPELPGVWKSGTSYANSPASLYADHTS